MTTPHKLRVTRGPQLLAVVAILCCLLLASTTCLVSGLLLSPRRTTFRSTLQTPHSSHPQSPQSLQYRSLGNLSLSPTIPLVPLSLTSSDNQPSANKDDISKTSKRTWITSSILISFLLIWKRQSLFAFLNYVKNDWLLQTLSKVQAAGPVGLFAYSFCFMLWEMTLGMTTPVETAAGAAFGVWKGILASGAGKFLGALLTFWLARYQFQDKASQWIRQHELIQLMQESIQESPLKVALMCRFSPLPEIVKNASMGVMGVPKRWYIASLLLHGFSFTCLWTSLGAETGRVLQGLPPSPVLKYLITGATWIGFGAPVMIGLWIKELKEKQKEQQRERGDHVNGLPQARTTTKALEGESEEAPTIAAPATDETE